MPENWNTYKLKDVALLKRGYDLPSRLRKIGNYDIISSSGVTDKHEVYKIKGPGVVTGRYGTIGKVFYTESNFWPLNTSLYVKDFKGNDPKFIYYLLQTINWNSYSTKSAVPGVDRNEVHQEQVIVPELAEQKSIASILSALDDKIELNLQMNKTLEKMAMALYKHWFVDFGPFQEKDFVESALGEIPAGWKVKKLKDVLLFKKENIKASKSIENLPYVPIDCLVSKSLTLDSFKQGYEAKSSLLKFAKRDFIFGAMRPYFHKVCIAPFDGITRSTAFIFKPRLDHYYSFALCLLNQETTINFASANSQGSTIPYAKWQNNLSDMAIIFPPDEIIEKFNDQVYPYFEMLLEFFLENQSLTHLRDTLLPKLISGEVRVKDVEKTLSEVL